MGCNNCFFKVIVDVFLSWYCVNTPLFSESVVTIAVDYLIICTRLLNFLLVFPHTAVLFWNLHYVLAYIGAYKNNLRTLWESASFLL